MVDILFEHEGNRVKGLAFHPTFPWILASFYNGDICLFDYIHKSLIDTYTGHDGPVRSVDFHNTQPLFVSGGDDKTVKIWNYTTKKCQFTLNGHKDYVRTVSFHKELPWLISCGDDMTIRIWNWINRQLLTTATGHDHYVMSAFFHPSQDWIVSSSLDSTIRIWDYSVLRKKFYEARSTQFEVITMDVTMIHKLEGHERGVNWAQFHPTLNLITSASDDKTIKIWKYSNSTWNEAESLRGHLNNVSCVNFHPKLDFLISNSEDKTLKIWDLQKNSCIETITKENDRFWILATHPNLTLFAAGHDSGFMLFRLESTRVPSCINNNNILFYKTNSIRMWPFGSTEKNGVAFVSYKPEKYKNGVFSIIRNPFVQDPKNNINYLILINENGKQAVVYNNLKNENGKWNSVTNEQTFNEAKYGCFIAKNRILLLTLVGLVTKDTLKPAGEIVVDTGMIDKDQFDSIYQATLGKFIVKFKNGIVALFDLNTKKIISETTEITDMKYVIWNNNLTYGALVGETNIFIINKNMEVLSKIKEKSQIKSVCFDENSVLFYSTYFHIKYALIEPGLYGIIKSTESPIYIMAVHNAILYYSDSVQNIESKSFNYTDVAFKINLLNKNYDNIVKILQSGQVFGLKTVENIQNSGFPDLSLKFVSDPKQKFNLALKSGKLEEAKQAAETLNDKIYYNKLADKAMLMGKLDIAEFCYVKGQNLDKLIFFYTISGKFEKLKKVSLALKQTNDNSRRFLNAIYLNNVDEKIDVLNSTGHSTLALLVAKLNNKEDAITEITENAEKIGKNIKINEDDFKSIKEKMKPIVPLKPVVNIKNKEYHSNWSSISEIKKVSPSISIENILNQKEEESEEQNIFNQISSQNENLEEEKPEKKKINADKWKDEDDEENDEEIQKMLEEAKKQEKIASVNLTQKDEDILQRQSSKSMLPGVQIALGNFKLAFNYLRSQLGITTNYEALKPIIKDIYLSSYSQIKFVPFLTPIEFQIRNPNSIKINKLLPQNGVTITKLKNLLNSGFDAVSNFEMNEALNTFRNILKYSIFFIATNEEEEKTVKEIISICTEYIYLTKISLLADETKEKDKIKYCDLICLMSKCKLELDEHKFLIYKKAKYCCKNIKNFITAVYFIKKMISFEKDLYSTFKKEFDKIKEEIDLFQKIGTNQHQLTFDTNEDLPNIRGFYSAKEFKRIGINEKVLNCPLCESVEEQTKKGEICDSCLLCTLGEEIIGFKILEK